MRKIIYTLIAILGFAKTYAQAPLGIPYQAAARKANGQALTNTAIKVRFSILDSVATGTVAFKETHTTTTNAFSSSTSNDVTNQSSSTTTTTATLKITLLIKHMKIIF